MKLLLAAIAALALTGCTGPCATVNPYFPGENFGASRPNAGLLGFNPSAGEIRCGNINHCWTE